MNKGLFALLLICFCFSQDTLSDDAIALTLKMQNTIWLDSLLAYEIDDALATARSVNDTLIYCTAWPDYAFTDLLFMTDTINTLHWDNGSVLCGDPYLDSLAILYNAISIDFIYSIYKMKFAQPLQMWMLGDLYEAHSNIIFAEPNGLDGDGHRIFPLYKSNMWHLVFSFGWGDCPAGCITRNYYYVLVENDSIAAQQEFLDWDHSKPYLYRWNIPEGYTTTVFESVDSMYNAIQFSNDWWVRRHAIEAMWRTYVYENPYYVFAEDHNQYELMRSELYDRIDQSITILQIAMNDEDEDVASSASHALEQISLIKTAPNPTILDVFSLYQNYPNPWNPITTIHYELPLRSDVQITIYDLLGREVTTLVSETQDAGFKSVVWDATNDRGQSVSAGLYLYQIKAGDFTQTRKMVLIK